MITDLKKILLDKGVKQIELSKQLGIPAASLSQHLNGWRNLPSKHLIKLAEYLQLPEAMVANRTSSKEVGHE